MLALERKAGTSNLILIEEPENHLSFSSMSKLISKIQEKCIGKQIIITTHSSFVLNKLGLDSLILLNEKKTTSLKSLPPDTQTYFKKLSGYDTLRLVLAKKAILVEGPSDELIIQKAYLKKHNVMPIADGIDVINVRGLSFARFLDIAKELQKEVVVVTDNDGDHANKVDKKYLPYQGIATIKVSRSDDDTAKTLEPQMIKSNGLSNLNQVFSKNFASEADLEDYMTNNKTDYALKIFETTDTITFPDYINDAV